MKTRLIAALLALTILFSLVPVTALGASDTAMHVIAEEYGIYITPLGSEMVSFQENIPALGTLNAEENSEYLTSESDVVNQIRANFKNRVESFDIYYRTTKNLEDEDMNSMIDAALAHTGDPTEGDYLRWNLESDVRHERGGVTVGTTNFYRLFFQTTYNASATHETQVAAAVAQLRQELALDQLSGYRSVKAIYDWLCDNVTFDFGEDENSLRHSAYGALVSKHCVCQGYALAIYRLLLEEGIDCRIISGDSDADGETDHAWNIAKLDGKYYNLDATWDAGCSSYSHFLVSQDNFPKHDRAPEYNTAAFHAAYPMATENYTYTGNDDTETFPTEPRPTEPAPTEPRPTDPKPGHPEIVDSGTCGENLTWTLDSDGLLTISGTGEMYKSNGGLAYPAWYALRNSILSVVIEEGVTDIGDAAFYECENLSSITIPESVTKIGDSAFQYCRSLTNIVLPESLTSIGDEAFSACSGLESITIPEGVTSIGNNAFDYCIGLSTVVIPGSVTTIGEHAFWRCDGLTNVTIPGSVTTIGDYAFSDCASLNNVTMEAGVTNISEGMFSDCGNLSSITIPDSVISIGMNAFSDCNSLDVVHYAGTEAQKANIWIDHYNWPLEDAEWHYECNGIACMSPEAPPTEPKPTEPKPEDKPAVPECDKDEYCVLSQFDDIIVNDWYHDGIHFCVEQGIMNGMGDGKFAPTENTTRAQLVTMLYRLAGEPPVEGMTEPFADVVDTDWFYAPIVWAVENKVVNGVSDTEFAPNASITREQVATILYRYLGEPAGTGNLDAFPDVADVSAYAVAPLTWAVGEGLITGIALPNDTTLLVPTGNATRAQIATILMRYLTA